MKQKEILVFGATGQIGKSLIRKLTKNNYKVLAVTRNIHQKGYKLKTQANPGYLEIFEISTFNEANIRKLIKGCYACINLIGILNENKKNEFFKIHHELPGLISKIAKEEKVERFIHISSLGVENVKDSNYAKSKSEGEKIVKLNFKNSVILKPSLVFSVDDNFTTQFMSLFNFLPLIPLYFNGNTKFVPIHVSDLTDIIFNIINKNINNITLECIGPEILTFKQIILKLLDATNKKRALIPLPYQLAKLSAKILQILPKPLITEDQLNLLKYDNINSGKYKTNFDLQLNSKKTFDSEIRKYAFNWKDGGQFSKQIKNSDLA